MRNLIVEFRRMVFEKKIIWFIGVTIIYVTVCSTFFNLRFKLDYDYEEIHYKMSAFKLWQDNMCKSFMVVLMQIVPPMIYVFSFMDDRENGIDNQICIRNNSNIYYIAKYITVIFSGMIYNFFSVLLIYFPLYFTLSVGGDDWNYLDRNNALVGNFFTGNTAMEFVLIVAMCYACVGGVCAGMGYVISMWIDNRVLVCILPYIILKILKGVLFNASAATALFRIIAGDVDIYMTDQPFYYSVYHFMWWFFLLSILFTISYILRIEKKR